MPLQRTLVAVGCGFAIVSSLGGLAVATGVNTVDKAVAKGLPSVVSAWRMPADPAVAVEMTKLSPAVLRGTSPSSAGPVAADEGYWLNAKTLAGGEGASLSVGQRMTIADRTYVIAELRPLSTEPADGETKAGGHLTLVVAREANSDAPQPRTLRFLIDGAQAASPDASAAAAPSHRSL